MNKILATIVISILGLCTFTTLAQQQKGRTNQTETVPVVIAIDNGKVYVDIFEEEILPGDRLIVSQKETSMIHPVTKKKINRYKDIAEVEVEKIYDNYIQTIPKPQIVLDQIKPGMAVRKKVVEQVATPIETSPSSTTSSIQTQASAEQNLLNGISVSNQQLPRDMGEYIMLKTTIGNKTICYNNQYKKNKVYKAGKKLNSKGKLYRQGDIEILRLSHEELLKLGYQIIFRWYNPDKDEHFDYILTL